MQAAGDDGGAGGLPGGGGGAAGVGWQLVTASRWYWWSWRSSAYGLGKGSNYEKIPILDSAMYDVD